MTDRTFYVVFADAIIGNRRTEVIEDTADIVGERQVVAFCSRTENVRRVIEFNVAEKTINDISEDIAAKVLALESDEGCIVSRDFLEEHLGCEAVADALREIGA